MRRALVLLSLVRAIVGEAPYHLPRPGPQIPALHYPAAPAPPPPPSQHIYHQQPSFITGPAPAPQYPRQQPATSNFGYNYPAPNPNYVQPAPRPAPQPIYYQPAPPAPAPYYPPPAPAPHYHLPAPIPQPQPVPQPQPLPHPGTVVYPQPSPVYGSPSIDIRSAPAPQYIAPQPAPQPQPLPQPIAPAPISYQQPVQQYQQQQYQQSGYSYQQPIQAIQPFQAQPINNPQQSNAFSSYQADSNQYSSDEQVHRDALDPIVVNRVQSIIRNDEHDVARNAGYQSLVSGVSLENAKPSVEILSFAHTSSSGSSQSVSSSVAEGPSSVSGPSVSYGQPTLSEQSGSSGSVSWNYNFLPQNKPATAYGPPN